jgi:HlyD family secretion protein
MKKKLLVIGIIVLFVAFIAIAIINNSRVQTTFAKGSISVQVDTVKTENISSKVNVIGIIEAKNKDSIYVDTSLKVERILVHEGDTVRSGQPLIEYDSQEKNDLLLSIDKSKYEISIAEQSITQADIEYNQIERELSKARNTLIEDQLLYKEQGISLSELNDARDNVKKLQEEAKIKSEDQSIKTEKLNLALKKKELRNMQDRLNKYASSTQSSISGKILKINVQEGQKVDITQPVIEIADLGKLIAKADVSQYDAPILKIGQSVNLSTDTLNTSYKGKITKISPIAVKKKNQNGEETVVEIEVQVASKDTLLKPGYNVDVEIAAEEKKNTIVVPILALMKDKDEKDYVYIVGKNYKVEKRFVTSGTYSDLNVEVSNVKVGEKVIVNPAPNVKEGVNIKPIEIKKN